MYCYPNNTSYDFRRRGELEMALQIIAGVRDPWNLNDEECETLNFYAGLRSEDFLYKLRQIPGNAKKAACALVADRLTKDEG